MIVVWCGVVGVTDVDVVVVVVFDVLLFEDDVRVIHT